MIYVGDNMMAVKRTNRSAALWILHNEGGMSRKRLAECMKLTPAAITKIVGEMISEGIVSEGKTVHSDGVGRREVMIELNLGARYSLGILINLRQAILSAVRLDGSVIFSEEKELCPRAPAEATVRQLSMRLIELCKENMLEKDAALGLGIAIRGTASADNRCIHNSFGALDTPDYPICAKFEEYTGLPTRLSNNVRALFFAHMFLSRDENVDCQFFLRCEYGIGASLSIRDSIWPGSTNQCSEIGHIPVVRQGGRPCPCGKCGCLETVASPTAIKERAVEIMSEDNTPVLWNLCRDIKPENIRLEDVLNAARYGDSRVCEIVESSVHYLGGALKAVIYTVDPAKIVLYGKMFENSYYLSKFVAEMREGVDSSHNVVIEKSKFNLMLENRAAGLIMVQEFFNKGGLM